MKAKMSKIIGFRTPKDGLTEEEKEIELLVGSHAVENLYAKLPTSRMKAIVAMHFELGYPQEVLATVFNVNQPRIAQEIKLIKDIFLGRGTGKYNPFKPRKRKELSVPEVIRMLTMLQDQQ